MSEPIEPSEKELLVDPPTQKGHATTLKRNGHPSSMFRRKLLVGTFQLTALGVIAGCASPPMKGESSPVTTTKPLTVKTGHSPVNGISMYYEIHGDADGTPLVLLHGGGSTIEVTYGKVLPILARHRKVIAVEEQGHGRTTDRDKPVRFDTSADDVAALLQQLKIEKADIMGFSNGASVAMQVAIRHPAVVRKLIFASSMTKRSGASPQFWGFMDKATFANMPQPLKDAFLKVNPDPQKLRTMHDKDLARMRDFVETPDEAVKSVKAPTLVVLGDRDIPTPEHALELIRLLPQARLIILPAGHGDYLGEMTVAKAGSHYPELTAGLLTEFLGDPMAE
jgi:pimeloyl-ACP methyl ester carboxylesterase